MGPALLPPALSERRAGEKPGPLALITTYSQPMTNSAPSKDSSRRSFLKGLGAAAAAGGLISAPGLQVQGATARATPRVTEATGPAASSLSRAPAPKVAADPTDLPPPVD